MISFLFVSGKQLLSHKLIVKSLFIFYHSHPIISVSYKTNRVPAFILMCMIPPFQWKNYTLKFFFFFFFFNVLFVRKSKLTKRNQIKINTFEQFIM
jgi:hypothetical protein